MSNSSEEFEKKLTKGVDDFADKMSEFGKGCVHLGCAGVIVGGIILFVIMMLF